MNVMVSLVGEAPMMRESPARKMGFPAGGSSVDSLRIQNLVERAEQPLSTSWAPPEGHGVAEAHPRAPSFGSIGRPPPAGILYLY